MPECQAQDPSRTRRGTMLLTLLAVLVLMPVLVPASAMASQLTTQTFTLQPGWNAIYLEVEPLDVNAQPMDAEAVFDSLPASLPLESAWAWYGRTSTVQFIEDPNEARLRASGWLGYFPRPGPDAFLTNLHRVEANRAYLLKLGGGQPAQWSVSGRPRFTRPRWLPGSFNLVGMPVDPAAPATFAAFFAASAAHVGQPIYRLEPDGSWRLAAAGESMASGEAFWVYTGGASDFAGALHLGLRGDGLDFGGQLDTLEIALTNRANVARTVQARLLTPGPIAYQTFDASKGRFVWQRLTGTVDITNDPIEPDQQVSFRLAPIRRDFADAFESILELRDNAGSRRLLPLRALAIGAVAGPAGVVKGLGCDFGGLWVGPATIDQVTEVPSFDPATGTAPLTPTVSSVFDQRLLIHVDGACAPRLIDEVFQLWFQPNATASGCFVLVTDRALLADPRYRGATLADGEPVGRRISTVAYHLDTDLPMTGDLGDSGSALTASIRIAGDHRTHPYRHRYHPDHGPAVNDCAQRYSDSGRQGACDLGWDTFPTPLDPDCGCGTAYPFDDTDGDFTDDRLNGACSDGCARSGQLVRAIALSFDASDPAAGDGEPDGPDWLSTRVAGAWSETILGLHKLPLETAGTFSLRRITAIDTLNPTTCPE